MKPIHTFLTLAVFVPLAAGCGSPKEHPSDAGPLITNEMAVQQARRAHDFEMAISNAAAKGTPGLFIMAPAPEGVPKLFEFVTTNTTVQQVVDRIGHYDHIRGSDVLCYEYDFSNGSAVLLLPERPFQATNRIMSVNYCPDATRIGAPIAR